MECHNAMSDLTPLDLSGMTEQLSLVEDLLSRLRTSCEELNDRASRKRHMMHVTLLRDQLNELKTLGDELVAEIKNIGNIQSYFQPESRGGAMKPLPLPLRPIVRFFRWPLALLTTYH